MEDRYPHSFVLGHGGACKYSIEQGEKKDKKRQDEMINKYNQPCI